MGGYAQRHKHPHENPRRNHAEAALEEEAGGLLEIQSQARRYVKPGGREEDDRRRIAS
jgi:hypothetical protein